MNVRKTAGKVKLVLLLFGLKSERQRVAALDMDCPQCGRKPCGLYLTAKKATAYFVTLGTLQKKYEMGCVHCDCFWNIDQELGASLHEKLKDNPATKTLDALGANSLLSALASKVVPAPTIKLPEDAVPCSAPPLSQKDKVEALIKAARKGDLHTVKHLLKNGVEIDARGNYGETALYAAAEEERDKMVAYLLGQGAKADVREKASGATVLHTAAGEGKTRVIEAILDDKAGRELLNAGDRAGFTPLMRAVDRGETEAVKLLLRYGADVHARSHTGMTARMRAFTMGDAEIETLIRQSEASRH